MRENPSHDEAKLPVFDADAPGLDLPAPGGPGDRGRGPGRGRGMAVAVGVLVLLIAGIAIGGVLETPAPTISPTPSGTAAAIASVPSATPRPTPPPPQTTPAVSPTITCGPAPSSGEEIRVELLVPDMEPVAGAPQDEEAPAVSIGLGLLAYLTIVGDACSTSWQIDLLSAVDGSPVGGTTDANPRTDLVVSASQSAWIVRVPVGDYRLVMTFRFSSGVEVVREWRVTGLGFTVPDAFLVDADGSRVRVLPGCGLTVSLANGYASSEGCETVGFPDGMRVLRVPAWSRIILEVPGWTITSWNGSCGRVSTDNLGIRYAEPVGNCSLGGYEVGSSATPPAPAQFLARPGRQVIILYVAAGHDGNTFRVPMYALVTGE